MKLKREYKSKYNLNGWAGFVFKRLNKPKVLCPGLFHQYYDIKNLISEVCQPIRFYGKEYFYDSQHLYGWFDDNVEFYVRELVEEIEKIIDSSESNYDQLQEKVNSFPERCATLINEMVKEYESIKFCTDDIILY